ncbi:MAG TPA: glycosyl hydrolase [Gemmataceae bacterium]|jgi:xylan 1,4-beta-xylosidase
MGDALFRCRLSAPAVPLPHVWEHTVGSCHAPLALRADWQNQLRRCHDELGFQYVRFHGLLSDQLGTLVRHHDRLIYSFFNADSIIDFLLSIDMRPFVELSFMPSPLASGTAAVFSYRGNVSPPADYRQWAELMRRLVGHWAARYGRDEVRRWYFEVWNEPNLPAFWAGTQAQYFELYRHTVRAIKDVDASFRVGGPATAANAWLSDFLDFCALHDLPADFVSTHHYPNDPLWSAAQDTESELAGGQRGILREWTREARRQAGGRPLLYTEWNASSNPRYPRQDEPYAAAFAVKSVLEASEFVEAYSFWTFTDIFEENYFPSVPFHGGFGLLNLHGIPKPTYRAFELLHRLGEERLPVEGHHETVDAWATRRGDRLTILLTNHTLPCQPIAAERVRLELTDALPPRAATLERIDDGHAHAKAAWKAMGEPEYLDHAQVEELEAASRLIAEPYRWQHERRTTRCEIELPPHSVAALTIELTAKGPT